MKPSKRPAKSNHGGKRPGAGRTQKYGEPTKTVSFRVPISLIPEITAYVEKRLSIAAKEAIKGATKC
jgi:hypothetical protein